MLLAGLALPLGCDSEPEPLGDVDLVGVVDSDAFLGVIANDDLVIAYVCDGDDASASIAAWVVASNNDGDFSGASTTKIGDSEIEVSIAGSFDGSLASGTLTIDGKESSFTTRATTGDEGTYRDIQTNVAGEELAAAWVVIGADIRGAVINRQTGDIFAAGNFQPTSSTFSFMELTFSPAKMTVSNY